MFKQKTIILTLILSVFLGLNACNKNENVEAVAQISKTTLDQIATITSVMKANPEISTIIKDGLGLSRLPVNSRNLRGTTEEIPAELQAAIDAFNADPNATLTSIAQESQGAEKIALLEGVITQKDAQTLENRAEVFVQIDIPPSATTGIIPMTNSSLTNPNARGINCSGDCKLHVMAGAGIAMGVSGVVYAAASWFSWQVKAVMIVAVGVSAGILFGAAKEYWDYKRNLVNPGSHGVEWRDFWNTVMGSFAGGAITFGIITVAPRPIIAVAAIGAGSIFLGWNTVKCCVFNQCPC